MKSNEHNNDDNAIIAGTCLLLSVSKADNYIDKKELDVVKEIIIDFFRVDDSNINEIINDCLDKIKKSTDIYEYGKILNNSFTYQDKVDFICCTFEVAFIDQEMHYLEEHTIKKISTILNVEHQDLIKSKNEIKNYLIK